MELFDLIGRYLKTLPELEDVPVLDAWDSASARGLQVCVDVTTPESVCTPLGYCTCRAEIMVMSDRAEDQDREKLKTVTEAVRLAFLRSDAPERMTGPEPDKIRIDGIVTEPQDYAGAIEAYNTKTLKLKIFYKEV